MAQITKSPHFFEVNHHHHPFLESPNHHPFLALITKSPPIFGLNHHSPQRLVPPHLCKHFRFSKHKFAWARYRSIVYWKSCTSQHPRMKHQSSDPWVSHWRILPSRQRLKQTLLWKMPWWGRTGSTEDADDSEHHKNHSTKVNATLR